MRHYSLIMGLVAVLSVKGLSQQCGPSMQPIGSIPGVAGSVYASTLWDPDGQGPRESVLVVGGGFTAAGDCVASNIAMLDLSTGVWSPLAGGVNGFVFSFATTASGELVVGGRFDSPGKNIAVWNGTSWASLGTGIDDDVRALAYQPGYGIVAGGFFDTAGGAPIKSLARWDGESWTPVGADASGDVFALITLPSGDVIACGTGGYVNGVFCRGARRWDKDRWHAMTGLSGTIYAVTMLADGSLLAGGFGAQGLESPVFHSSGDTWTTMGSPIRGKYPLIRDIEQLTNGEIFVAGWFPDQNGDAWARALYRWNGGDWSYMLQTDGDPYALTELPDGSLLLGGRMQHTGQTFGRGLSRRVGDKWETFGRGLNDYPMSVVARPDGTFIAGGYFDSDGTKRLNNLASWNGIEWMRFDPRFHGTVSGLENAPNGDLLVRGEFSIDGYPGVGNIARWDGVDWYGYGGGLYSVYAMTQLPNGDVVVGGAFKIKNGPQYVARWDGAKWRSMGAGFDGIVRDLAVSASGDVVAVGDFTATGNLEVKYVARWNGQAWSAIGSGLGGATNSVAILPGGDIVTAGWNAMRWNGVKWSSHAPSLNGAAYDVVALTDGNTALTGVFRTIGNKTVNGIARGGGTVWSGCGTGIDGWGYHLAAAPNGSFMVVGDFDVADGRVSPFAAFWNPSGAPFLGTHPESAGSWAGQKIELAATPAVGVLGTRVQWYRNGVQIVDGPGGSSDGGGTVTGASVMLESPTQGVAAVLTITQTQPGDSGEYTARFINDCGEVETRRAIVQVLCISDSDGSGFVDGDDFDTFIRAFESGSADADVDHSGGVDHEDMKLFLTHFEAGC